MIYSSQVREELGNATERPGKGRRFDLWAKTDLLLGAGSKVLVCTRVFSMSELLLHILFSDKGVA